MSMKLDQQPLGDFLDAVADKSPTPGGGAVASVTAALAAALAQMVLRYSQGKKSLAEHAAVHDAALQQLQYASTRALELAVADAEAYGNLNSLWKLDQADPIRQAQWAPAVAAAIAPPRAILADCLNMLELMSGLPGRTNKMLDSDLAIAAVLAEAAARAGAWSVRVNLPLMDDAAEARQIDDEAERDLTRCRLLRSNIEQACRAQLR